MKSQWTLLELLQETVQYLSQKAIPNPRLDGEVLLADTLGCSRIELYLRYDQPITSEELDRFREAIRRRSRREPLAYITGIKEFWSLPFHVTPRVLIPRPETELLVEKALDLVHSRLQPNSIPLSILEIGTGCGAIAISLAVELRDRIKITATDFSPDALDLARANARTLDVEGIVKFQEGDLFEPLDHGDSPFSMILSNPPYIPSHEIQNLAPEVRNHEPLEALDGGTDGLAVIGHILNKAPEWLDDGGVLLMEIGDGQRISIEPCLQGSPVWKSWDWLRDLQGKDRVLVVERICRRPTSPLTQNKHHG
jgi:release factor glutamine methyltransferase